MTVGARLKEERQRLGLSQQRMAGVAGVSKNTAINWEKGDTSPTASALLALADAGADAVYILTGKHSNATTVDLNNAAKLKLNEIEDDLSNQARAASRRDMSIGTMILWHNEQLNLIAHDAALESGVRERADDILRLTFNDKEAGQRRTERLASKIQGRKVAERNLEDALEACGVELPSALQNHLIGIVEKHGIVVADLVPFLGELADLIKKSE